MAWLSEVIQGALLGRTAGRCRRALVQKGLRYSEQGRQLLKTLKRRCVDALLLCWFESTRRRHFRQRSRLFAELVTRDSLWELMRVTRQYCLLSVPHEPFFCIANFLRGKNLTRLGNDIEHVNHWGKVSFVRFLQDSGLVVRGIEMSFPWLIALAEIGGKG